MPLTQYKQKRNFKITSEPKAKVTRPRTKFLYVIQKHAASHLHYDFRLELNGVLLSWAVPKGPCLDPTVKRLAVHVEDHPVAYGSFEGAIPKGEYGGGTVMLWDTGEWIPSGDNPVKDYKKGHMTFTIKGKKLKGAWKLIQIKSDPKNWLLMKVQDQSAKPLADYDIEFEKPKSVVSHKTLEKLTESLSAPNPKKKLPEKNILKISTPKKRLPAKIKPALATLVDAPPEGCEWIHEIKFDGYRLLAFIENKKSIRLMTRGSQDWTEKFSQIAKALQNLKFTNTVLDGEIVVLNEQGHSSFQLLQNNISANIQKDFIYYVFDLIFYEGHDLSGLALIERKEILANIIANENNNSIRLSEHIEGSGKKLFNHSCKLGLEGIVSKSKESLYQERRTKDWVKTKCIKRQEFIIAGYTPPQGSRLYFGSLLLAVHNKGKLVYSGHVGTGFNQKSLKDIYKKLKPLEMDHMPFETIPPESKRVVWVKPELVAEVEFTEWTTEGVLRHPSFKGLRSDKPAKEIGVEQAMAITKVKSKKEIPHGITHPDKILYPKAKITKGDLFNYYQSVQEWILPYIVERPLTLLRCPNGQSEKCFYQKHPNESSSDSLHPILVKEKTKSEDYLYIEDIDGLLSLVQMAVLEMHPWGSSVDDLLHPDTIIFDLDPAPDVKWKLVTETAFLIRNQLAELKLKSYVKSTGGKGLHVVVPIKPEYTWEQIKIFSHTLVQYLASQHPDKYTTVMSKSKRTDKIFLDYLRNQKGATAIAPYSARALEKATVATPLDWDELTQNIKDTTYTIKTLPGRLASLRKDPWHDYFKIRQSLHLDKIK